jgi:hypothetical protein
VVWEGTDDARENEARAASETDLWDRLDAAQEKARLRGIPLAPADLADAKPGRYIARTLWTLTACGSIPSVRVGRRVLYSVETLHRWIAERERPRVTR